MKNNYLKTSLIIILMFVIPNLSFAQADSAKIRQCQQAVRRINSMPLKRAILLEYDDDGQKFVPVKKNTCEGVGEGKYICLYFDNKNKIRKHIIKWQDSSSFANYICYFDKTGNLIYMSYADGSEVEGVSGVIYAHNNKLILDDYYIQLYNDGSEEENRKYYAESLDTVSKYVYSAKMVSEDVISAVRINGAIPKYGLFDLIGEAENTDSLKYAVVSNILKNDDNINSITSPDMIAGKKAKINVDSVDLKSYPDYYYPETANLKINDIVEIIEECNGECEGGNKYYFGYKVRYKNKEGYILDEYLTPIK